MSCYSLTAYQAVHVLNLYVYVRVYNLQAQQTILNSAHGMTCRLPALSWLISAWQLAAHHRTSNAPGQDPHESPPYVIWCLAGQSKCFDGARPHVVRYLGNHAELQGCSLPGNLRDYCILWPVLSAPMPRTSSATVLWQTSQSSKWSPDLSLVEACSGRSVQIDCSTFIFCRSYILQALFGKSVKLKVHSIY